MRPDDRTCLHDEEPGRLLEMKDLGTTEFPPIEKGLMDGEIAFGQHSGGHTPGPNWPVFLAFAERYFQRIE